MLLHKRKNCLVTGGAGFIGSAFIRYGLKAQLCETIVNVDALTYAGSAYNLSCVENDPRYYFIKADIADEDLLAMLCAKFSIDTMIHFAAETHVDRSIDDPLVFYRTNVGGTLHLLEVVRRFPHIHFHHVSTDEVYGSLGNDGVFSETSPYRPNSPYAASKAASDHFVKAYANTYGLSVSLSHCSNNYGPYQHAEKFIPKMIQCCLAGKQLPIYGNGENRRDWLYVDDHVAAIWLILESGSKGEVYDIGGECELSNIALLQHLINEVADQTQVPKERLQKLVSFVPDRPGHDFRYAIDSSKIQKQLGWKPQHTFPIGIQKTVEWYISSYARCEVC